MTEFRDYSTFVNYAYAIAISCLVLFFLVSYLVLKKNEKLLKKIKSKKETKN